MAKVKRVKGFAWVVKETGDIEGVVFKDPRKCKDGVVVINNSYWQIKEVWITPVKRRGKK